MPADFSYVSSNFQDLYPAGAGFPEHISSDLEHIRDEDPARFGIHFVESLFPAVSYGTPFTPDIFLQDDDGTRSMWGLYTQLAVKAIPSCVLVRISDARVFSSLVFCGSDTDRRLIYETYRPNDRPAVSLPSGSTVTAADRPALYRTDEDYLFVGSAGSFNYGHFLVDDLPRIKAVQVMRQIRPYRPVTIVMTSYGEKIDRVRTQAISLFCGIEVPCEFLEPNRAYAFPSLYYATPVSVHPISKNTHALDFISAIAARDDHAGPTPRLVYVGRSAGERRQISNEADLLTLLKARGFTVVHADRLSFREQVDTVCKAHLIVGTMGAAMTNTIFAPRDAALIYLSPKGWTEPFYWDLASTRGQHYSVIYGDNDESADPIHLRDFTVDLNLLSAQIDRHLDVSTATAQPG